MRYPYESSLSGVAVTTGIVLAAGASSRMGQPKALLELPNGVPLAIHQCNLLRQAGCLHAVVVLGADAERIAAQLPQCQIVINPNWQHGRFSSLQAGLRGAPASEGYLILPVDSVGIAAETLAAVLATASNGPFHAVRPVYDGQSGRVLWISRAVAQELLQQPPRDLRIDEFLRAEARPMAVTDEAILHNVNTPAEWEAVRAGLR